MTIRDSCSRCSRDYNLQPCSKCQSVWYCSSKCELAASKSHKPECQILDGSDPPPPNLPAIPAVTVCFLVRSKITPAFTSTSTPPALPNPEVILGVKIFPESAGSTTNLSSWCYHGLNPRFVEECFIPTDHIFSVGELCPITELYGIPILILFDSTLDGLPHNNFPALDLCIGAYGGRGCPSHFTGTAFVVRRDKKPLTKETVETMYHFHVSLKLSNFFKDEDGAPRLPNELTPKDFREFSEKYWTEEAIKLEQRRYRHPQPFLHRVFSGLINRK